MTILLSLLSWVVSNPIMILGAIGIWFATGWISDVKGYFEKRQITREWAWQVDQRDKASEVKDEMITNALFARDNAQVEIAKLRAELDDAEIKRKVAGIADCTWSDHDIRLLNGRARRR